MVYITYQRTRVLTLYRTDSEGKFTIIPYFIQRRGRTIKWMISKKQGLNPLKSIEEENTHTFCEEVTLQEYRYGLFLELLKIGGGELELML